MFLAAPRATELIYLIRSRQMRKSRVHAAPKAVYLLDVAVLCKRDEPSDEKIMSAV